MTNKFPICDHILDMINDPKYLVSYPDILTEDAEYDVGQYLTEVFKPISPKWSISVLDWPNNEGGAVFVAWIENDRLMSLSWNYTKNYVKRG